MTTATQIVTLPQASSCRLSLASEGRTGVAGRPEGCRWTAWPEQIARRSGAPPATSGGADAAHAPGTHVHRR